MKHDVLQKAVSKTEERKKKHMWYKIVTCMAAVVVFCTVYALILPAITLEQKLTCELEEHQHTVDCYAITGEKAWRVCGQTAHQHDNVLCYMNQEADVETAKEWEATLPKQLLGEYRNDILMVAKSQLDYQESTYNSIIDEAGYLKGYTRYGAWAEKPYDDWNAYFLAFCLHYAGLGQEVFPWSADYSEWIQLLTEKELYQSKDGYMPESGDIIFWDMDEDGIADRVGLAIEPINGESNVLEILTIEGDVGGTECYVGDWKSDKGTVSSGDSKVNNIENGTVSGGDNVNRMTVSGGDSTAIATVSGGDNVESVDILIIPEPLPEPVTEGYKVGQVQYVQYELNDERILGYGILPEQIFYCEEVGHLHEEGCYDEAGVIVCELAEHVHIETCINPGPLSEEQQAEVDKVIALIDIMPSADEIDAALEAFYEADDADGEMAYMEEVIEKVCRAYQFYDELSLWQKTFVTNVDKLLELEYIWSVHTLAPGDELDVQVVQAVEAKGVTVKLFNYTADVNYEALANLQTKADGKYLDGNERWQKNAGFRFWAYQQSLQGTLDGQGAASGDKGYWPIHTLDANYHLVQEKLVNGYPYLNGKNGIVSTFQYWDNAQNKDIVVTETVDFPGGSLDYLFDENYWRKEDKNTNASLVDGVIKYHAGTMSNGGGLFQQDEDGYYYYNSAKNAASYDADSNQFVLYDHVIRPYYENRADGQSVATNDIRSGNFLPFTQLQDDKGKWLVEKVDPTKYTLAETGTQSDGTPRLQLKQTTKLDFWFGMMIEVEFHMPVNGQVNGEDMIFEFTGDDDVYVFVDDMLLLDLGGAHTAWSGTINFAEGIATGTGNADNPDYQWEKRFADVYTGENAQKLVNGTFEAYTEHTMKFFYMDRGANVSHCNIKFNLASLPENSLRVTKEINAEDDNLQNDVLKNDVIYPFRIVKADENGQPTNELYVPSGAEYYLSANGAYEHESGVKQVGDNGIFYLRAGQSAYFENMLGFNHGETKYIVQELIPFEYHGQYSSLEYWIGGSGSGEAAGDTDTDTGTEDTDKPTTMIYEGSYEVGSGYDSTWDDAGFLTQEARTALANAGLKYDGTEKMIITYQTRDTSAVESTTFQVVVNDVTAQVGGWQEIYKEIDVGNEEGVRTLEIELSESFSDLLNPDNQLLIKGQNWIITKLEVVESNTYNIYKNEEGIELTSDGGGLQTTKELAGMKGMDLKFDGTESLVITYKSTNPEDADATTQIWVQEMSGWTTLKSVEVGNDTNIRTANVILNGTYNVLDSSGIAIKGPNLTIYKVEIKKAEKDESGELLTVFNNADGNGEQSSQSIKVGLDKYSSFEKGKNYIITATLESDGYFKGTMGTDTGTGESTWTHLGEQNGSTDETVWQGEFKDVTGSQVEVQVWWMSGSYVTLKELKITKVETDSSGGIVTEDEVIIDSGKIDIGEEVTIVGGKEYWIYQTKPVTPGNRQFLNFENFVVTAELGKFSIKKVVSEHTIKATEGVVYEMQVALGGELLEIGAKYILYDSSGNIVYPDSQDQSNVYHKVLKTGIIPLKEGQSATIEGILSGTTYEIKEVIDDTYRVSYSGNVICHEGEDEACEYVPDWSDTGNPNGTFDVHEHVKVTVTNAWYEQVMKIPITKETTDTEAGITGTFQFDVENGYWNESTKTWTKYGKEAEQFITVEGTDADVEYTTEQLKLGYSSDKGGFQVSGTKLLDANGNAFVMRGVNYPYAWFAWNEEHHKTAIPAIKENGFNTVRIVLSDGQQYTKTTKEEISALINICKANELIAVLEVHDVTGSDSLTEEDSLSPEKSQDAYYLEKTVDYWIEMADVLHGSEAYVIVNIANEWYGTWDDEKWIEGYTSSIPRLRDAGIQNTLMVDCAGWGQYPQVIFDHGTEVFASDTLGNTMFSIHMYDVAGKDETTVKSNIDNVLNKNLCLVIGEFAHEHGGPDVDEATIMSYCEEKGTGWLAWSWTGNSGGLESLDISGDADGITEIEDFTGELITEYGEIVIESAYGAKATAQECTVFEDVTVVTNIFSGSAAASAWGQAVSLDTTENGGTVNVKDMNSGDYIGITYTGESADIELIFKSFDETLNKGWVQMKPSEVQEIDNGAKYAIFTYDDIMDVYQAEFTTVDQVHVGACATAITVTSVDVVTNRSGSSGGNNSSEPSDYYYKITEVVGDDHYIYDDSEYIVHIRVTSTDGTSTPVVTGVWKDGVDVTSEYNNTKGVIFVNQRTTTVTVTKDVPNAVSYDKFWFTAEVTDENGNPIKLKENSEYTVDGNKATFWLRDGGKQVLTGIPFGAVVTVTEDACDGYLPTAAVRYDIEAETCTLTGAETELGSDSNVSGGYYVHNFHDGETTTPGTVVYEFDSPKACTALMYVCYSNGDDQNRQLKVSVYADEGKTDVLGSNTYSVPNIAGDWSSWMWLEEPVELTLQEGKNYIEIGNSAAKNRYEAPPNLDCFYIVIQEDVNTYSTTAKVDVDTQIHFTNTLIYELPETGGVGTKIYILGGMLTMSSVLATLLIYRRNKRRKEENVPS